MWTKGRKWIHTRIKMMLGWINTFRFSQWRSEGFILGSIRPGRSSALLVPIHIHRILSFLLLRHLSARAHNAKPFHSTWFYVTPASTFTQTPCDLSPFFSCPLRGNLEDSLCPFHPSFSSSSSFPCVCQTQPGGHGRVRGWHFRWWPHYLPPSKQASGACLRILTHK